MTIRMFPGHDDDAGGLYVCKIHEAKILSYVPIEVPPDQLLARTFNVKHC